jgi:hypothetical protein
MLYKNDVFEMSGSGARWRLLAANPATDEAWIIKLEDALALPCLKQLSQLLAVAAVVKSATVQAFLGSIVLILVWMLARLSPYHVVQRRRVLSDYAPDLFLLKERASCGTASFMSRGPTSLTAPRNEADVMSG